MNISKTIFTYTIKSVQVRAIDSGRKNRIWNSERGPQIGEICWKDEQSENMISTVYESRIIDAH